jgi:hypothetical protein
MALTATKALTGFVPHRKIGDPEILLIAGDPGTTYTKNYKVVMSTGILAEVSDSSADAFGTVHKTTVCPAATTAFPIPGAGGGIADLDGSVAKTLVPVEIDIAEGTKVWRATFDGHQDEAVASYAASTRSIGATTGFGTDDYGNGSFIYCYTGPGKGELNIIEDYDHAAGNGGGSWGVWTSRPPRPSSIWTMVMTTGTTCCIATSCSWVSTSPT